MCSIFELLQDVGTKSRHLSVFSSPRRVPVVLHAVLSTAWKALRDVRPLVPKLQMRFDELLLFVQSPRAAFDVRSEVIVPSLAALLAYSPWKGGSNIVPALSSML